MFAISPRAESRVARIELSCCKKPGAQFLLFFFCLLPQIVRLRSRSAGLVGFGRQNLLLRHGFGLGLFRLFFLACRFLRRGHGFLLHALGFGLRLFGLSTSLLPALRAGRLRIRTPLGFGFGIGPRFRFARRRGGLRFIFRSSASPPSCALLPRSRWLPWRPLQWIRFVLLLPVNFFRVQQLLVGLR